VVAATDVAVEDLERSVLGQASEASVVGEERGGEASPDGSYWLVDPICGSRNLASGIPLYCVNLALVEGGRITVAVVGDPSGEIHVAERGRGAWALDRGAQRPLVPSDESNIVVIEDGHAEEARRERAARFMADAIRADRWDLRSLSTTLALPYVAAGPDRVLRPFLELAAGEHAVRDRRPGESGSPRPFRTGATGAGWQ
jgi:myo-inositol-1(or 4)-monophosphatase